MAARTATEIVRALFRCGGANEQRLNLPLCPLQPGRAMNPADPQAAGPLDVGGGRLWGP